MPCGLPLACLRIQQVAQQASPSIYLCSARSRYRASDCTARKAAIAIPELLENGQPEEVQYRRRDN